MEPIEIYIPYKTAKTLETFNEFKQLVEKLSGVEHLPTLKQSLIIKVGRTLVFNFNYFKGSKVVGRYVVDLEMPFPKFMSQLVPELFRHELWGKPDFKGVREGGMGVWLEMPSGPASNLIPRLETFYNLLKLYERD